jgi:hypothetical protein
MKGPFRAFIMSKLFISARSWYFDGLKLNVTHGGNILHSNVNTSLEKRGVKPL